MSAPPLTVQPLSLREQARLTGLIDALAGYLGKPGDWGYDTQLGLFTIQVLAIRQQLKAATPEPAAG
ncbi:hypothetical protein [Dyella lutea]|uniref:Uncharacterized protein n=1 Tax=Dyella lutea TaxID=2950441 RepID=A0ABT1FDB6_9GAMM|nr:hypothetical protein [Dyella lutea]MCP1375355.1 hypothetical protein [Dyella lutea]